MAEPVSTVNLAGPPPVSSAKAWRGVMILWLFYVLSFMDRGIISLMVGPIMQDLNISRVQMGFLQGFAFALVYSLAAVPLGWAIDRVSRRGMLMFGLVFWSSGTVACGLVHTFEHMLIARASVGLGEAMLIPAALSLIADMFPRDRLPTATAVFSSGATFGAGGVLIIGGGLLNHFAERSAAAPEMMAAWRQVFVYFGVAGIVLSSLVFLVPDLRAKQRAAAATPVVLASMREFGQFLLRHAPLMIYLFLSFSLLGAVVNAFLAWAPHHFQLVFGWNIQKVGLVLGMIKLIVPPLGVITGGYLIERAMRAGWSAPHFRIPMICALIGGPLQALGLMQTEPVKALILVALGQFIFNGYGSAQYSVLQLLAPPALRGRLAALYLAVIALIAPGVGAILPPLLDKFAATTTGNMGHATALAIVIITSLAVMVLALGRRRLQVAMEAADQGRA